MKKNLIYFIFFLTVGMLLTACGDDESAGKSRITYYPTISVLGDNPYVVAKGTAYQDPGYVSFLNGEDVSAKVTVSGSVDTSKSGLYTLTYYTVKNEDGFGASASRQVFVCDPNDPAEGIFTNQASGNRVYNGNTVAYGSDFQVLVWSNGNGTYTASDFFGGWYEQRAGYGSNYAMKGVFSIADDGSLSLVSSKVAGWGDSLNDLTGTFDAATATYTLQSVYNNGTMFFNQTWVKQ
jgi:hypothetical protein